MKKLISFVLPLSAALLLFLAGCSSKETVAIDGSLSPHAIIAQVNSMTASVQTFSALGSLSVETPQMSQAVGFDLAVKKPDSIMISIEGPFGITVGKALFTKESFIAYNALNNTLYQGNPQVGMQSLPFFAGINTDIMLDALSGIRRFGDTMSEPDSFSIGKNSYIFTFMHQLQRTKFFVDGRSFLITRVVTYRNNGSIVWEERYTYTRLKEGRWEPSTIWISVPDRSMSMEFIYDEISLNIPLTNFTIAYPLDAERVTLR